MLDILYFNMPPLRYHKTIIISTLMSKITSDMYFYLHGEQDRREVRKFKDNEQNDILLNTVHKTTILNVIDQI